MRKAWLWWIEFQRWAQAVVMSLGPFQERRNIDVQSVPTLSLYCGFSLGYADTTDDLIPRGMTKTRPFSN
ncbi:hypothetical protein KP509_17G046200 [Ceratopteris richardii]|uniref:Uncharacterized protein n=1 Tax=Ceratopteris richardii TaxID=49495 RepID=A0A8T2SXW5_CERRI|nr:hypothetical protein KP509_17G046200 [Ceratopteris richardii]